MTPNGAIVLAAVLVGGAMLTRDLVGLAALSLFCLGFGAIELHGRIMRALAWSAAIMAPLAAFMAVVWVGVVGRSPGEIAAGVTGTRAAALTHVTVICTRLFLIALVTQLVILRFADMTPLAFTRALRAPVVLKKLIALTLSWIDTILHAVDRSRTALITAGVITPRFSARNAANGWILVQTVWLSVITIAIGRLRDKWPAENTLARLDEALAAPAPPFRIGDGAWIAAAIAAVATARVV
ncbi:MAG TPA: hypothetical protein VKE26_19445 [Xanthobacteraceae bacterium]|nr:hypothetical protein [Xanthobacteraceae bacterium]